MSLFNRSCRWGFASGALGLMLATAACERAQQPLAVAPVIPTVQVAIAKRETIPVLMNFAGTVEAIRAVNIVPRVSGYIDRRSFDEGTYVDEGSLLYQIDPRPFQAALDSAKASLERSKANIIFWNRELKRYASLAKSGAVAKEKRDEAELKRDEAKAQVAAAQADIETASLNLEFADIKAPFKGRTENTLVYKGTVVTAGRDVLTTLVQMNPVHVVFGISRRQVAQVQRSRSSGLAPKELKDFETRVPRSDGTPYEHPGHLDFVSARVDPTTDSLTARAVFPNAGSDDEPVALLPGQYVPITLVAGKQPDAILIPQAALIQSQVGSQVMVVDEANKVKARTVEVGRTFGDRWVIDKGLEEGERVVVDGVQKVRSGMSVKIRDAKPNSSTVSDAAKPKSN